MTGIRITPTIHYVLHAVLGGCIGLFTAFIFWMIYWFQTFDLTVPDSVRLPTAVWDTAFILIAIIVFYHVAFILLEILMGAIAPFPWRGWLAALIPDMEDDE